jgi:uncharacterized YigZ family protein
VKFPVEDTYLTIATESRSEIKVKGSRFIGESFLVRAIDAAIVRLDAVRKREFQATHHCYACVVGLPGSQQHKYSDDGEPGGTAGRPIYDTLAGRGLTNGLVVVTRYFGGTKLGAGGLSRAYSDTARAVLELSGVNTNYITRRFRCDLQFPVYDTWLRELHKSGATVVDSQFAERVTLTIEIRAGQAERLKAAFVQLTSGKGLLEEIGA